MGPHSAAGGMEAELGHAPGLAQPLKKLLLPSQRIHEHPPHSTGGPGRERPRRGRRHGEGQGQLGPGLLPAPALSRLCRTQSSLRDAPAPCRAPLPCPGGLWGQPSCWGGSGREREAWGDPTGRRQHVDGAAPWGSCGVVGRTPGPGWGSRDTKKAPYPKTRRRRGPQKCRRGDKTTPGLPRDPGTEAQPALSAAPSSSSSLRGAVGSRGEAGRARTWLRRTPSPPRFAFAAVPGPGRRPGLTFLCVPGLPGRAKPKYSHSLAGHMRAGREGGEEKKNGGAASNTAPRLREGAGTEQPLPRPRPHSPTAP